MIKQNLRRAISAFHGKGLEIVFIKFPDPTFADRRSFFCFHIAIV